MLLVTTADEATWGRDEDILFLGDWCLVSGREEALKGRRYRVLPYHWDDREKMHRDARMLRDRYEQILPRLAERLNAIHGTMHDIRYWRLVAGPWLLWMLTLTWERRENVARAVELGATETIIYRDASLPTAPYALIGPLSARTDDWNHAVCARLAASFASLAIREIDAKATATMPAELVQPGWKRILKRLSRFLARNVPQRMAIVNLHVKPAVQIELMLSQGQVPLFLAPPETPTQPRDSALRHRLNIACGEDDFGRAFAPIFAESFPDVLLEGYGAARRQALASFPRWPKIILTATGQYEEMFTLWAAERPSQTMLIILQHGGHYGVDHTEMMEDHELAIADRYCSWGWTRAGFDIIPMPSFKLQAAKATPAAARQGLLAIYDSAHRYPNRIYSVPEGGQRRIDNEGQLRLINALPGHIRAQLRIRSHPYDDGYGFRQLLHANGLGGQFDRSPEMLAAVRRARMCLIGSNSTPLLEALASGTPTVAFFDPQFAEERSEAKPFFDALRMVGIVHTDPITCAAKIAQVWSDPEGWWNSVQIVTARDAIMQRFGLTQKDWQSRWRQFLAAVSSASPDSGSKIRDRA